MMEVVKGAAFGILQVNMLLDLFTTNVGEFCCASSHLNRGLEVFSALVLLVIHERIPLVTKNTTGYFFFRQLVGVLQLYTLVVG